MNNSGLFWHVHHDHLFDWCWDAEERIEYIKSEKPTKEVPVRLRLFKPVRAKLGNQRAFSVCDKAWNTYEKARAAAEKAEIAWEVIEKSQAAADKTWAAYRISWSASKEARAAWDAYIATIKPGEAKALHAKECPNCPWNGTTIFPSENM